MSKEEKIVNYPTTIDIKVALLEQSIGHINQTLVRFEKRFDNIDSDIKGLRSHFDRLISGIYLMFGASLIAVIFKVFHG